MNYQHMWHPLQNIIISNYQGTFWFLLTLTVLLIIIFNAIAPEPGIIEYEFNADEVLKKWQDLDKYKAAFSLGLDFLFIVIYSTTISFACIWAANVFVYNLILNYLGIVIAWGQLLAALLDVLENTALIKILFASVTHSQSNFNKHSSFARNCAIAKFTLIIFGLIYVISAWLNIYLIP